MCRNIVKLRFPDRQPSDEELRNAALQYVRKISGYRVPSRANQEAFERAVERITQASQQLLNDLDVR